MNTERATSVVENFRTNVERYGAATAPGAHGGEAEVWGRSAGGLLGIVVKIAEEVGLHEPERLRHWNDYLGPSAALTAADELLGLLEASSQMEEIFGPTGPLLAANRMHPWVWDAAARLWDDGHRRAAVQQAAAAIFDGHFPAKLGILKGTKNSDPLTLSGAFAIDPPTSEKPRLRLPGFIENTDDWKNAHRAAQNLGIACGAGFRNLSSHTAEEMPEDTALESLATLSLLARWIDRAEVVTV